jgi:hypothetical protein
MSWLLLIVAAAFLNLVVAELFDWCAWLAERLIRRAARRLPKAARERYQDEWLGELDAIPGRGVSLLIFALWISVGASRTCRELAGGHEADSVGIRGLAIKHASDRVLALALLIAFAPVIVVAAIAVRLSSRGPVFFRQRRVGRDGKVFDFYKFRSMRVAQGPADTHDESSALDILLDVDRRTAVGRFLRSTSLDELPQLFNVLRGDMSLVGPRPERPEFAELFSQDIIRYDDRHRVKAGDDRLGAGARAARTDLAGRTGRVGQLLRHPLVAPPGSEDHGADAGRDLRQSRMILIRQLISPFAPSLGRLLVYTPIGV